MPKARVKILVVDDEVMTRMLFSVILAESGYGVSSAVHGFSAIVEMVNEIPDIVLSDLDMPGMSGSELISVVRRWFPAIQVLAMSGRFSGDSVPAGPAADAFYEKGTDLGSLLLIVEGMTDPQQLALQDSSTLAPIWIPGNGHEPSEETYAIISCPQCLGTFPQLLDEAICPADTTNCVYCHSFIHYTVFRPADQAAPQASQQEPGVRTSATLGLFDFN